MPVQPKFLTVEERQAIVKKMHGQPTIPAPERYVNEQGFVQYQPGDPVPIGIARALGWFEGDDPPLEEPEPINASARGRKIRAGERRAERGRQQQE